MLKGNAFNFALNLIPSHSLQDILLWIIVLLSCTFSLFLSISFSSVSESYSSRKWNKAHSPSCVYLFLPPLSKLLESIVLPFLANSVCSLASSKLGFLNSSVTALWSCSVSKSRLTLRPHGLQHARLPCPSLSPWVYSNSCLLSQWCHLTISSSVTRSSSATLNLS